MFSEQAARKGDTRSAVAAQDESKTRGELCWISDACLARSSWGPSVSSHEVLPSAAWLFWDPGEGQVPDVPQRQISFQMTRLAMSCLTKQRLCYRNQHPVPTSHPHPDFQSYLLMVLLHSRGLWICATYKHLSGSTTKKETDPILRRHL